MKIYIIPTNDVRLATPLHKCEIRVVSSGKVFAFPPATVSWFEPPGNSLPRPLQLIFERPAFFGFTATHQFIELDDSLLSEDASLIFSAGFARSGRTIEIEATPPQIDSDPTFQKFAANHPRWFVRR